MNNIYFSCLGLTELPYDIIDELLLLGLDLCGVRGQLRGLESQRLVLILEVLDPVLQQVHGDEAEARGRDWGGDCWLLVVVS